MESGLGSDSIMIQSTDTQSGIGFSLFHYESLESARKDTTNLVNQSLTHNETMKQPTLLCVVFTNRITFESLPRCFSTITNQN